MKQEWKLSSFDTFCLSMTIKGAWIYEKTIDIAALSGALDSLCKVYPHLCGAYCEKTKSISWDDSITPSAPLTVTERKDVCVNDLTEDNNKAYDLVPKYDIEGFKKGKVKPLSAQYVVLKDGCVLIIQGAHACMDGHSFYSLVRQFSELTKGHGIQPLTVNQNLLPKAANLSKEDTLKRVQELGWVKMGPKKLIKMLWFLALSKKFKNSVAIEVSQEDIQEIKKNTGCGINAIACAIAMKELMKISPDRKIFQLFEVFDLRNRINGIDENFFGNISQAYTVGTEYDRDMTLEELCKAFQKDVEKVIDNERMQETVELSLASSEYSLPYYHMDASLMSGPKPFALYGNNQLKFRACEIDFGAGLPEYVLPNDLPDMLKIWQPKAGGPIQLVFGSYASKIFAD